MNQMKNNPDKNKDRTDLHVHTIFSDGIYHPREIVDKAVTKGLSAIAVTDHDCVEGVQYALLHARKKDLEVIPGIELSAFQGDREVHILGYFIDINSLILTGTLDNMKENRKRRFAGMIDLLSKQGIEIPADLAEKESEKGTVGRLNLARLLILNHSVNSIKAAFDRFLGVGKSCYVPHEKLYVSEAVEVIHSAGGCAVLAHPGTIDREQTVNEILSLGIDGLEVYHPGHRPHHEQKYLAMAKRMGLISCGGSDFHGSEIAKGEPDIAARTVGSETVEELRNVSEQY